MNIDRTSDSYNLRSHTVTSKYFSGQPVMDESLSDFQEKKSNCIGPKKSDKAPGSKAKPKKALKRIRGQKDIRTALKSKKNELVSYANDFDKICKQSGIDVDSEHLQVAIALSKSLQSESNSENESLSSTSLSAQERTGKIRTTLQEYGFKVPEIKITTSKNRKTKHIKQYKLLLTTEAEKQQVISDKYAQVLLENLNNSKVIEDRQQCIIPKVHLYNIATNISYELIKNNSIYYIEELIEESPNTVGCFLRDWSEIPGRPPSPKLEPTNVNFSEIECSQEELNVILSGSFKSAQEIVKCKWNLLEKEFINIPTKISDNNIETSLLIDTKMNSNPIEIEEDEVQERTGAQTVIEGSTKKLNIRESCERQPAEIIDVEAHNSLSVVPSQIRSCSPDIFDEEVSSIMEVSKRNSDIDVTYRESPHKSVRENTGFMDLTVCVNEGQINLPVTGKQMSQLSQGTNITKRRSNDFMEITDCVAGSSQPLIEDNKIDLTQRCEHDDIIAIPKEPVESKDTENMDLTQSSDDSLPFIQISGTDKSMDDTIILNHDEYGGVNYEQNTINPKENEKNRSTPERDVDILAENEDNSVTNNVITRNIITIESEDETEINYSKHELTKENLDLSDKKDIMSKSANRGERLSNSKTESFFEEFVYQHESSESEGVNVSDIIEPATENVNDINEDKHVDLLETSDIPTDDKPNDSKNDANIDLTQSTDSFEELNDVIEEPKSPITYSTETLGKNGDVSIDYDEMFDNVVEKYSSNSKQNNTSSNSMVYDIPDDNDINTVEFEEIQSKKSISDLASSQNSEVFEISDKELDYSMHKSRHENFEIDGLSVMDNLSNARSSKSTGCGNANVEDSMNDSFLPIVNLKDPEDDNVPTQPFFTETSSKENVSIETPKNGKYVIKLDNVTPMIDYSSLPTPERNKELEKYGLKPFKRRRAIQLLTHIYHQTHPILQSVSSEDLPSPSKKRKTDYAQSQKSSRKPSERKSPKKNIQNHLNSSQKCADVDVVVDNNRYEVTSEVPVFRDIECCEEDWVFQKREKAKVHSCRVPLHIAFHNYVSARCNLREAILQYEPVNIDVIHKGLVANGHRYDPKDLLKFLDKKCVTVKTTENNPRNKKHY